MKTPSPEMAFIFSRDPRPLSGLLKTRMLETTGFEQEFLIISKIKLSAQFKKVTT